MNPTLYIVPPDRRRERVDKVLAQAFPEHSRVAFQRALEAGLVKVDGKVISQAEDVRSGQTLEFSFPEVKTAELKAGDSPLADFMPRGNLWFDVLSGM